MTLRVIGAGLGRTGTKSLHEALPVLLGGPCYHMTEVFQRPDDAAVWQAAAEGSPPDWTDFFDGWTASVDWPACAFWEQLAEAFPEAPILLSTRTDAETWWKSANDTIFEGLRNNLTSNPWMDMWNALTAATFTPDYLDPDAAMAAYEAHNAHVRATADPARLVEYQPGDGWEPICAALGVPVPDLPFPHANSTEDFRKMLGLDSA